MRVYNEISLVNFSWWGGAKLNAEQLDYDELEQLDYLLSDLYPEGCSDTLVNDIMWFEFEQVCDWLGLELNDDGDIVRE